MPSENQKTWLRTWQTASFSEYFRKGLYIPNKYPKYTLIHNIYPRTSNTPKCFELKASVNQSQFQVTPWRRPIAGSASWMKAVGEKSRSYIPAHPMHLSRTVTTTDLPESVMMSSGAGICNEWKSKHTGSYELPAANWVAIMRHGQSCYSLQRRVSIGALQVGVGGGTTVDKIGQHPVFSKLLHEVTHGHES